MFNKANCDPLFIKDKQCYSHKIKNKIRWLRWLRWLNTIGSWGTMYSLKVHAWDWKSLKLIRIASILSHQIRCEDANHYRRKKNRRWKLRLLSNSNNVQVCVWKNKKHCQATFFFFFFVAFPWFFLINILRLMVCVTHIEQGNNGLKWFYLN